MWFSRRSNVLLGTCLVAGIVFVDPASAAAQSEPAQENHSRREPTRLYFGMWTTHLKRDVLALNNNWVVGLSYRGFFGGTFLNSFGRRAYSAGIQRTIVAAEPRPFGASLGYRVGLVSGYDGRFMSIANKTPVLPFVQPFATVDVGHIGVEVQYTFVIVSVAASYRF